jgi:hypothetical protein
MQGYNFDRLDISVLASGKQSFSGKTDSQLEGSHFFLTLNYKLNAYFMFTDKKCIYYYP